MSRAPNHPIAAQRSTSYHFPPLGRTYRAEEIISFSALKALPESVEEPNKVTYDVFDRDTCISHIALHVTAAAKVWMDQNITEEVWWLSKKLCIFANNQVAANLSLRPLLNEQLFELPMQLGFIARRTTLRLTAAGIPGLMLRVEGFQMEYRR